MKRIRRDLYIVEPTRNFEQAVFKFVAHACNAAFDVKFGERFLKQIQTLIEGQEYSLRNASASIHDIIIQIQPRNIKTNQFEPNNLSISLRTVNPNLKQTHRLVPFVSCFQFGDNSAITFHKNVINSTNYIDDTSIKLTMNLMDRIKIVDSNSNSNKRPKLQTSFEESGWSQSPKYDFMELLFQNKSCLKLENEVEKYFLLCLLCQELSNQDVVPQIKQNFIHFVPRFEIQVDTCWSWLSWE